MSMQTRRVDRSDSSELSRRVRNFLQKQVQVDLRRLQVEVAGDVVHIRGQVESDYARDLTATCCQRVAGVRRVVNEVTVELPVAV